MCAGFAQVTLVELRASYKQGCKSNRNKKTDNPNQTTNKKTARATFKVTHKALKARGWVRLGR